MKKYLAYVGSYYFPPDWKKLTIHELEVDKITPKKFYWNGTIFLQEYKGSYDNVHKLCDTREEALDFLLNWLERKINSKQSIIAEAESSIQKMTNAIAELKASN